MLNAEKYEYDLAQRVNQLMNDPALRASMGAAGRLHAEKYFSWESIAKKTERLYTNILKDSFHVH
jgi:starch synthase